MQLSYINIAFILCVLIIKNFISILFDLKRLTLLTFKKKINTVDLYVKNVFETVVKSFPNQETGALVGVTGDLPHHIVHMKNSTQIF